MATATAIKRFRCDGRQVEVGDDIDLGALAPRRAHQLVEHRYVTLPDVSAGKASSRPAKAGSGGSGGSKAKVAPKGPQGATLKRVEKE